MQMPKLCIHLFGKFGVHIGGSDICTFDARKAQELLCYLLIRREQIHSRETLAGLLWGDSSTAQSKKSLRQALWQMQAALGMQSVPEDDRIVRVEAEWVQVNPKADLWIDIAQFEQTFNLIRGRRGAELDAESIQALRSAVDLYSGDLLEGWYQDWCIYERERLQTMYLAMLDKLMAHCETHGEYETGLAYGAHILRYDRAHEQTHRRMMNLYSLAGDRAAALRQYQRCAAALREELGAEPSRRTAELHERIQADRHGDAPAQSGAELQSIEVGAISAGALERLKQAWRTLADLERRVHQDIETLEMALRERHNTDSRR
jgi:DNA-binding SARP family transcriptional activator